MTERASTDLDTLMADIAALDGSWRKAVFSRRVAAGWEKLTAEPVALAAGPAAKLVYHEDARERTETVAESAWPETLRTIAESEPRHVNIMGREGDVHGRLSKRGRWLVSRGRPSLAAGADREGPGAHDRPPSHLLPPDDPAVQRLFIETGIFGRNGKLLGEASGKYRQVQHFLELLRPLDAWDGAKDRELRVVDAGCGRAYLSLALYALGKRSGRAVRLTGVDRSEEVLAPVRESARRLGFERTEFVAESIEEFTAHNTDPVDLLVSLHACDTATDEALAAGVRMSAAAIVLVPCCHHELVAQIEERVREGRAPAAWGAVLESGLLTQRLADIITDALRTAALEACGYRVSVIEFVSPEATARNVMLRAERRALGTAREISIERARERYRGLATEWGVEPALERLLGDRAPARA